MNNINEIAEWIEGNSQDIIANINQESIDVYNFLKAQFNTSKADKNHLFQFVYRSFYRIDNAGLSPEFKEKYFELLQHYRNNNYQSIDKIVFKKVLDKLYKFPNRKGSQSFQFSFTTKLFNTIDDNVPIYDSQVAKMFSLPRPYQKEFNVKFEKYMSQLEIIKNGYEEIINNYLLPKTIEQFDKKFSRNNLSMIKKLDFIFWSSGKIYPNSN